MPRRNLTATLAIVALLTGLLVATLQLFRTGMAKGDLHPPFSSLRSAPDGMKLLYESLSHLPELTVSRHYRPLRWLTGQPDRTLLVAGIQSEMFFFMEAETVLALERFMEAGGRIVLTMDFEYEQLAGGADQTGEFIGPPEPDKSPSNEKESDDWLDLQKRWGFRVALNPTYFTPNEPPATSHEPQVTSHEPQATSDESPDLPTYATHAGTDIEAPEMYPVWYDLVCFELPDPSWTVEYLYIDEPTVVSRSFGAGSLVMVSHSTHLSNNGVIEEPDARYIAWLLGSPTEVIFDESHLGVVEQRGLMWLSLHHRLYWTIGALCLGALLTVWRNAVPLLPRRQRDTTGEGASGVYVGADVDGLHGLIERFIDRKSLLRTCWDTWKRKNPQYDALDELRKQEIEAVIAGETDKASDIGRIRNYQRIAALLKER